MSEFDLKLPRWLECPRTLCQNYMKCCNADNCGSRQMEECVRSETGAIPSVEQDALRVYNGPLNLPALTVGPVEFTEKQMDALISHMNCDLPPLEKIHQDALRNYNGPLPMPAAPPLPTPRTDALENDTQNLRQGEWDSKALELARTLERENAELRAQLAEARRTADYWKAEHLAGNVAVEKAERQRDEARADERERCAQVAEDDGCDQTEYRCGTIERIAAAIRALKEKSNG